MAMNPNPNPNPNPQLRHPHCPPPPPPPPDLPTVLSTLRRLIRLADTSLSLLPAPTPSPHNPTKPLPPSSNYQKPFTETALLDPDADLCFSFDEYADFGPSFFYRDCPGAVSYPGEDGSTRTFTLPGILSIECANFSGADNDKVIMMGSFVKKHDVRFLPSELWFIRAEIEGWNDYPTSYSYNILRAIVCSLITHESEFFEWVIANSPHHDIVIDVPMRDHIVSLFQLCAKAIVREAVSWAELVLIKGSKKLNPATMSFNCPILMVAMKWLSSQLSVLYNEVNGKRFAMTMLKHWMLVSSNSMSLFMVEKVDSSTVLNNMEGEFAEQRRESVNEEKDSTMGKSVNWKTIFVSQVAAAVAALHERALLEEKVNMLRVAKPIPNFQRVAEHAFISNRADEERKRRTNYRPLLEHDGIVWQRSNDQEGNTTKTREELLAEQRDYKRRRVSYRGKKLKRNATEVMRDIIGDYMDSILRAGGIGCLTKVSDEAGKLFSEPPTSGIVSTDSVGLQKNVSNSSTGSGDHLNGHKEQFRSHDDSRYTRFKVKPVDDRKQHSRDSSRYYEHRKDRRTSDRDRHSKEYYSHSLEREKSYDNGHRVDTEHSKKKHSHVSGYGENSSHDRVNYQRDRSINWDLEEKDRRRKHLKRDHRANSVTSYVIEDRYDPNESRDVFEDGK